jgi:activator of HSP90 ATPase
LFVQRSNIGSSCFLFTKRRFGYCSRRRYTVGCSIFCVKISFAISRRMTRYCTSKSTLCCTVWSFDKTDLTDVQNVNQREHWSFLSVERTGVLPILSHSVQQLSVVVVRDHTRSLLFGSAVVSSQWLREPSRVQAVYVDFFLTTL